MPQPNDLSAPDLSNIPVTWSGSAGSTSQFDVWEIAIRNKVLLIAGLILGSMAGEFVYNRLGPAFQASAKINVSKPAPAHREDETAASSSGDRGEHPALIKSPMIIGEAVRLGMLDKLPSLAAKTDPDDQIEEIQDALEVKRISGQDRSSFNIFELTVENPNLGDATKIVNSIIQAYESFLATTRQQHSNETITELTRQCDSLNEMINQKKKEYLEFRKTAPLQWTTGLTSGKQPGSVTNVYQERVKDIERERNLVHRTRADVTSKIKTLEDAIANGEDRVSLEILVRRYLNVEGHRADGFGIPELNGQTELQVLEQRLLPLVLEERRLLRTLGVDHPDVVNIRRSIQTIYDYYAKAGVKLPDPEKPLTEAEQQTLARRAERRKIDPVLVYLASLKHELAVLNLRDETLAADFDAADKEAKAAARYQIDDQNFNEEITRLTTEWEKQQSQLTRARFLEESGGYRLKVISPCMESLSVKRHIKITGAMGGFGFALAFAFAWLREFRANRFRTVDDLQQALGLPLLGRIPQIDVAAARSAADETGVDASLYYFHFPGSPEAEAYRSVRTTLYVAMHAIRERVLQITSPEPEDGKSTLACNLALAIAQSGKKVLLVDADMRRPKVQHLFGLRSDIGLADVLAGEIEWRTAVTETQIPKLSVLGAGRTPPNPAELLATHALEQILSDMRAEYDFVLVDTPPLLAVSDPCVVSASTDRLLLVVNPAKNRRDVIRRVQQTIATHGMKVLGIVANGVTRDIDYTAAYSYREGGAAAYFSKSDARRKPSHSLPSEPTRK